MEPESQPENEPKKKPRGKPFTGRADPRNGNQRREEGEAAPEPVTQDEQGLLAAMVWVQNNPRALDRTELQKDCRKWKAKDLKGFMAKRADLERAALLAKGEDPKGDDPDRDVGTENAMRGLRCQKAGPSPSPT